MMGCLVQVISFAFLVSYTSCQSKDAFTDENRPYEFGFTIDGEQHRYEKKDEKGIIMGEFGFITADGIYHVTVYATDENGNFKILKMKNIKVGFPPGKPTTTTPKPALKQHLQLNGLMGCSGCLIPESSSDSIPTTKPPSRVAPVQAETISESYPKLDPRIPSGSFQPTTPENRFGTNDYSKTKPGKYNFEEGTPKFNEKSDKYLTPATGVTKPNTIPDQVYYKPLKSDKQPQLNAVEMKILDYMARLYKFNYTLSFHGHEETGDVGGNKNGSYFSNGRDGYQRKVVYTANEFGYQPKVTLVKLDADSTPNEQTEKEKTILKGSEFIWFYKKK